MELKSELELYYNKLEALYKIGERFGYEILEKKLDSETMEELGAFREYKESGDKSELEKVIRGLEEVQEEKELLGSSEVKTWSEKLTEMTSPRRRVRNKTKEVLKKD